MRLGPFRSATVRYFPLVPNRKWLGSLDHVVGTRKKRGRYGQTERLGGLHIDDQLEMRWLLDRQVGWLGAFQDTASSSVASEAIGTGDLPFDRCWCLCCLAQYLKAGPEHQAVGSVLFSR
jgi:hypothetical protein